MGRGKDFARALLFSVLELVLRVVPSGRTKESSCQGYSTLSSQHV